MEEDSKTQQTNTASKRSTLESLDREDLIKKCKGLLGLAQKAKQAKDEYAEKNQKLEEELHKYEKQKEMDEKNIIALKEIIDNLTENKLTLTTEITDLKNWKAEMQKKSKEQLNELSNFQIENEALKRQIGRLTQENEDLLSDLDNVEKKYDQVNKLNTEQQEILNQLEKEITKWKEYESTANKLQLQYDEIVKENEKLKETVEKNKEFTISSDNIEKCDNLEKIIKEHESEIERLKLNEKEQNEKIQNIKQKLSVVAKKLKKLKISKEILLETVQEYSESISNWQNDILNASNQLCDRITNLEKYKSILEEEKNALKCLGDNLIEEKNMLEEKLKLLNDEKQNLEKIINELKMTREGEEGQHEKHQHHAKCEYYEKKILDIIECCEKAFIEYDAEKSSINENSKEIIAELKKRNDQQQKDFDSQVLKIEELKMALENSRVEIEKFKKNLSEVLDASEMNEEFEDLKAKYEEQSEKIQTLNEEKENYLQNIDEYRKILEETEQKFENEQKKYEEKCKKLQALQENFDLQSVELEKVQKLLQDSEEIKSDRIIEFEEKLISNKKTIDRLEDENKNLLMTIKHLQNSLTLRESENSDLLSEMRELNDALKGRGDVISRQQEKIKELEIELKQTKDLLSNIETNLSEKENQIAEKETKIDKMNEEICSAKDEVANLSQKAKENEKIIKNLSDEVTSMRDKIPLALPLGTSASAGATTETQSEILSTSTYSKAEETARMREVDESLEEKYGKLRTLAIKLKKKVQEQAAYITNLEKSSDNRQVTDEKTDITSKLGNVQVKNLQVLQNENDKLLDEVEKLKKINLDCEKQVKELNDKIQMLENRLENFRTEDSSTNLKDSGRKSLENAVREYQNEIKSLKQEKDSFNLIIKEMEKEKEKLKNALATKENEVDSITKQCEKLRAELEKKKAIEKKTSLLNLEIEAYEKSLNETTKKLEMKTTQLAELSENLKIKESANQSLHEQIRLLEESLESEKVHSQELKQQVDIHQAKIKEIESEKHDLKTKNHDLTIECETLKSDVDNLHLQISEIAREKDKMCMSLKTDKEKLLRKVFELEEKLESKMQKLKETERDLEDLRADYASYKVKAQSVLRQNQTKETSRERELEEEITVMHSTIEALKLKIKTSEEQVENNERKIDDLRQDNERIQKRCKELIDLLEESRIQNETLLDDNKKQSHEYQESLKSHRLQIETLTNAYKKQIDDIERKHSIEIEELKKRGITTQENRLVSRIGPFGEPKTTDEQKIDLILMEREDAEGSETSVSILPKRKISSTAARTTRSKHDLIPLDELLNSSLDENQNDTVDSDMRSISPTIELQNTKERLSALENQVRHLTSLLAETEQDLARLTQLNEVLKEEVRRHERSIEREQHMHNSEYIKNVLLKFLTLSSGDERSRLVPVLNTILKLSPEETQALQSVARGSDSINRSWGSYLPIWSNHQ